MNQEIKELFKKNKIPQWKIADVLGVSEWTLLRWLRHELTPERKAAILDAIEKVRDAS